MEMDLPLITPLSRKYYIYAKEEDSRIHHKAIDVRLCLEKVCDSIVYQFVSEDEKKRWKKYKLHEKITACYQFMDRRIVENIINAKIVGNKGGHEGEEGKLRENDIEEALSAIKTFSLEIFYTYFKKYGFWNVGETSWIPTVFSTLPPIYRIEILKKYYSYEPSLMVIDKLSKAYSKGGLKEEGKKFLSQCLKNKEINEQEFEYFNQGMDLLEQNFDKLGVAQNLEEAKRRFNDLLPAIEVSERDMFVCLVSMILTGEKPL